MKKISLLLIATIFVINISYAQNTYPWPSTGNIGIGTTSPNYPLDVSGSMGISGTINTNIAATTPAIFHPVTTNGTEAAPYYENLMSYGNATASNYASIYAGNAYYSTNGTYLQFRVNARGAANTPINVMTINPYGNVGIGITNPVYLLDAGGTIHSSITGGNNLILSKASGASLAFDNDSGVQTGMIEAGTSDNHLEFWTNNSAGTALNERMRITNTGNIGIGTTTPAYKLDVNGGFHTVGLTELGGGYFHVSTDNTFVASASYTFRDAVGINNPNGTSYIPATSVMSIGAMSNGVSLVTTGNVGVGTTTPDAKLTVNGTAHAKEVLVDLSIFPDYVFKPTYHLPTLPEVKTYIDQNHHLPDMPTEADVIKNGLKVGETEALLTKKVEELTLYLIDLKKDNDELKKQNKQLKKAQQAINKKLNHLTH